MAHLTGSPFIIGSAGSPLAFAYSARVEPPTDPLEHAIERRLNYVRLLGADTADKRMDLFLTAGGTRTRRRPSWPEHFGAMPPQLLALHPTGSDPYKWWPAERFVELGNYLYRNLQAPAADHQRQPGPGRQAEAIAARSTAPAW